MVFKLKPIRKRGFFPLLIAGAAFLAIDSPGHARSETAEQLAKKIEAYYRSFDDLRVEFVQTYLQKIRGKKQREQGVFYVKRPNKIRWDYLAPRKKFYVYNGKQAYLYIVADNQVIHDDAFTNNKLSKAISFLWGGGKLQASFTPELCEERPSSSCKEDACHCLKLEPKVDLGSVAQMYLLVEPKQYSVHTAILLDPLGNETRFEFKDVKTNTGLKAKHFELNIPEHVTVLKRQSQ